MADEIAKIIDPKVRPAFTLLAALITGAGLVLAGIGIFEDKVRTIAVESWITDAFKTKVTTISREAWASDAQAGKYDHERFAADIAALKQRIETLERQAADAADRDRRDRRRRNDP